MNAKAVKKMANPKSSTKKLNISLLTSPKTVNRRAKLGLEFLDMQKQMSAKKSSTERRVKAAKERSPGNVQDAKENGKRKKIKLEKKEAGKKAGKSGSKLREFVRKIITEPCSVKNANVSGHKVRTHRNQDYIRYLIPEIKKEDKESVDSELMNSIKVELLNEINPNIPIQEVTESMVKRNSAARIQKLFRKRLKEERNIRNLNPQQFSDLLQGATPNEKLTHISSTNTIEDFKLDQSEPSFQESSAQQENAGSKEAEGCEDRQLAEMRLMLGSEKKLKGSLDLDRPSREFLGSSIFEKNSFDDFTSKKVKELLREDHASSLIELQEEAVKYKEQTEKQYMQKMYQAKKYSLKTYQRKRKELEKWITKEKAQIKKTKTSLLETWKKTAMMVEEVDKSKVQLSRILMRHTMSYSNERGVNLLGLDDADRPVTDRESERETDLLAGENTVNRGDVDRDALIKPEVEEDKGEKVAIKDAVELYGSDKSIADSNKDNLSILIQDIEQSPSPISNKREELFHPNPMEDRNKDSELLSCGLENPSSILMQLLATKDRTGIQTDQLYISQYIDDLFAEMCLHHKAHLVSEINRSLVKPPLEMLRTLQSSDTDRFISPKLPHEISPMVPESTYQLLETRNGVPCFERFSRAHNRALFDAVNEALNLIRPYGLNAEPMPWSSQGRILFKSISDQGIIVKNIKNMVLDWASFEVGTLPGPEFMLEGRFDEEYFAGVRERQLATLLAQEVIDNEEMWLTYEAEEAEVAVDVADMVLEELTVDLIFTLIKMEMWRKYERNIAS
eukprot:TRINITY_DN2533_c0_g1_i8.p1 TRINITY_DN2533_c0_g1~~TRINITY_DN2533_c0_g1_i8.p1  ORF type:complete len:791 (+),score=226.07 TRINITY_DN2533_c0_g1_i8:515-2887(+)